MSSQELEDQEEQEENIFSCKKKQQLLRTSWADYGSVIHKKQQQKKQNDVVDEDKILEEAHMLKHYKQRHHASTKKRKQQHHDEGDETSSKKKRSISKDTVKQLLADASNFTPTGTIELDEDDDHQQQQKENSQTYSISDNDWKQQHGDVLATIQKAKQILADSEKKISHSAEDTSTSTIEHTNTNTEEEQQVPVPAATEESEKFTIQLRIAQDDVRTIQIGRNDTIEKLRKGISKKILKDKEFKIIFDGEELTKPKQTLEDIGIEDEEIIDIKIKS